jgi:tripartite ATP-independent transporter DctP family solute receptor
MVGLAYYELGFRQLTNSKRPIGKVEDIAGLKLRVIPNPINIDWVKALGANPTPMPFPEVYGALETKAIDGQENPVTVIRSAKMFEVQKYLTLTRHMYNPQALIVSRKLWDSLSADEKKLLQDAAAEATAYQRKVSREQADEALAELKKAGMQVTELAPAELQRMRDKVKPLIEKYTATVGAETVKDVYAEVARHRK